jgi:hypothetical protein
MVVAKNSPSVVWTSEKGALPLVQVILVQKLSNTENDCARAAVALISIKVIIAMNAVRGRTGSFPACLNDFPRIIKFFP